MCYFHIPHFTFSCIPYIYPSVQEQLVVRHSRNLIGWLDGYGPRGGVEDTFTFLPARLTPGELLYPSTGMYRDLSVHRLCFYAGELIYFNMVFTASEWYEYKKMACSLYTCKFCRKKICIIIIFEMWLDMNVWCSVCKISLQVSLDFLINLKKRKLFEVALKMPNVLSDQMVHFQSQRDLQLRNPVHLMDMPALTPKTPPPTDLTLTSKFQGWVYIALIAKKVRYLLFNADFV